MKWALALVVACVTLALVSARAPLMYMDSERVVPDQYIVVFNELMSDEQSNQHISQLAATMTTGEELLHTYSIGTFKGYAARLTKERLMQELENPNVQYIEADQTVTLADSAVTQNNAEWGLARIDTRALSTKNTYTYWQSAGTGVTVYVIDTGILTTHTDFGGRAFWGYSSVTGESNTDLNGHGTHCASTAAGTVYGVAKKATLIAVKVLNAQGSGTNAGVIAGVDWVTGNHTTGRPSVANMSLGGGISTATDTAVTNSIKKGISYAIAAGNSNANACNSSPARVPSAVTVGASDSKDARASFSNFGTCLDVFAPGVAIKAAWIGSNTATNTISGTSMASPHVAGAIAVRLGHAGDASPDTISSFLRSSATPNVITNPGTGSPNFLLYSPFQ